MSNGRTTFNGKMGTGYYVDRSSLTVQHHTPPTYWLISCGSIVIQFITKYKFGE